MSPDCSILLVRHAEISMLIAAGEHRFIGRAIDEALEVEDELGAAGLVRAMTPPHWKTCPAR